MTIQTIRFDQLVASSRNVRSVKVGVDALAASIAAEGLLQNLIVVEKPDGKFEVIAGERRRRAIGLLVKAKTWTKDAAIPCEVRDGDNATTVSLAENTQRAAMHPADAYRAFARLETEGLDETAIANRYGYDPREVRRLLSLGNLSPKVLNALAADKIDVATARAFTLTDDHKRQETILGKARSAQEVRRMLTESKADTGSRRFKFVGSEAYEAAGGTYTRDLFAADDAGFADNAELLAELVDQRFASLIEAAEAEGWNEVMAVPDQTPYEVYQWHRLYPQAMQQLDGSETADLARINAEIEALMDGLDEDSDPDGEPDIAALVEQRDAIEGKGERAFTSEQQTTGILVIAIGPDGEPSPTAYTKRARGTGPDGLTPKPPRALYDQRMTEDLSLVRTVALQDEISRNPQLARCVLIDALLPIVTSDAYTPAHSLLLRSTERLKAGEVFDVNTLEMPSPQHVVRELLAVMPADAAGRFAWLQTLDDDAMTRLQSYCTAALIDATTPKFSQPERVQSAHRIARAASLDMTKHWDGGIEFWSRLSRKAMLAALDEAIGPEAVENCHKLGKMDLAKACSERMADRGWLPPALRTPDSAAAQPQEDRSEAEGGDNTAGSGSAATEAEDSTEDQREAA